MIQLNRLEGFYWVARTGGYARAARAFPYPITQPAVHQQVKRLEAELGLELFERVAKDRVELTQAGRRLFAFVRPFYDQLASVVRSLQEGEHVGELRVSAGAMLLRHLMPAWIRRIHRRWPRIHVHLEEARVSGLDALRRGDLDLLVDYVPDVPEDVAVMQVAELRPFLVLPRAHDQAKRERIDFAALADDTFISYLPGLGQSLQLAELARRGLAPPRHLSASTAEVILGFVAAGLGYSFVPWLDDKGPRAAGVAVRALDSPRNRFPIYAAWRKDTPGNQLLDAALETAPEP